ncbi:MAG TPA: SLBB domain-containing protein, partial [Bryobacteraceae bacterium]
MPKLSRKRKRPRPRYLRPELLVLATLAMVAPCMGQQTDSPLLFGQFGQNQNQRSTTPGYSAGQGIPTYPLSSACLDEFGNQTDCFYGSSRSGYGLDGSGLDGYAAGPMATRGTGIDSRLGPAYPFSREQDAGYTPSHGVPEHRVREPLTEFQRFVASTVGQVLPIFGASLFEQVPATFAPVDRVPVSPDYVIGPGDALQLTVWGQINFTRRLLVDRSGDVYLPEVGRLALAGMKYGDAAPVFRSGIGRVYKSFDLSVAMDRLRSIQVFVMGEARRPGSYTVSSLSTLVNAIFESGGPSSRGSMRNIELKRGDQTIHELDLYELLVHGDKSNDARLAPGDVILIPAAGPRVAVAGSVEHPGIYELRKGSSLGEVLQLAGGLSPMAAVQEAVLERISKDSAFEVQRIMLNDGGRATELRNGDIIRLIPVVPRFENAVTLRGNVANPGRFPWQAGMRISDLIPSREALLTRAYWTGQNQLISGGQDQLDPSKITAMEQNPEPGAPRSGPPTQTNLQAASWNSQQSQRALTGTAPNFREETRQTHSDSSLGAATSSDDVPPVRTFLPTNVVQPSVPEVNWDYAVIERLDRATLATRLIPFDLGKVVLKHDQTADLLLERGDVVTIFSKADFSVPRVQQTRQVRLEGEVARAGVYTVGPGETLRSLVENAGGLTSNAYLYGAQLTRESTRREQQKRYDDFINQLEQDINQGAANVSGRVISPAEAATAQTAIANQRELLDRLRKLPVSGRIVLDLNPTSRGTNALPALALENGDRLYVPSRPSTVNVVGTVFEQAAFLYDEDLHVGDYLKKAGGPTRSADKSHMFVIRADGSVIAKSTNTALFSKNFATLAMHPGDTLVVPAHINKTTFTRGLMDWSQIFSNLA